MPIIAEIKKNKKGGYKMPKWMECSWRRVPCEKNTCPLCNNIKKDCQMDYVNYWMQAIEAIKRDAEQMGINMENIDLDSIQEPPDPEKFPLYNKIAKWQNFICKIIENADTEGSLWLGTEAAADLVWYKDILAAKAYRQLCNRWEVNNGDADDDGGFNEFDYQYTKYILKECFKILSKSLNNLFFSRSLQKGELMLALVQLRGLKEPILNI